MTDKPKDISDGICRINPVHRMKVKKLNDAKNMDNNILTERIRHLGHHLDLIVKFEWRENKGKDLQKKLNKFLEEYKYRNLENKKLVDWSISVLEKYEKWYAERKPQLQKSTEISMNNDFWKLVSYRRSIRVWSEREVSDESVKKLLGAAIWAPSSCNRQAWKFTIVPKEKRKLLQHRLLAIAPIVILISIDERPYFFHEKHAPALDVGFAAQNMLLAATALGLGACPIYFAYPYVQKARKELGIENYRKVYLAIALGYPAENPVAPSR